MSKQPHTEFRKGQRVIVLLRNGGQFVGKYESKFRNGIIVDGQRFTTKEIRQVSIYREAQGEVRN